MVILKVQLLLPVMNTVYLGLVSQMRIGIFMVCKVISLASDYTHN